MNTWCRWLALTLVCTGMVSTVLADPKPEQLDDTGFTTLFDGKSLKGWHVSAKSGHSGTSKHQSGGRWVVEDGAITGSQDIPGNGGIILSDETYGDFEIVLEMRNDFGPDSGLFLRSTDDGKCYQCMIDYHADGNLGGLYGEGIGGQPHVRTYDILDQPHKIKLRETEYRCPFTPEEWPQVWEHNRWNEIRARITGSPPHIITWVNRVRITDFQDSEKRLEDRGHIGLQVHGGGDYTKQFVRYRNIRIKPLK